MGELANCLSCNALFVKTRLQDVCAACNKKEQVLYDSVYNFIRKKENRMATLAEVCEATEVEDTQVIKWIKSGKLKLAQVPNLTYPCEKCSSARIRQGRLCDECTREIKRDLQLARAEEERKKKEKLQTFYSQKRK